jgi:hypothetical protein
MAWTATSAEGFRRMADAAPLIPLKRWQKLMGDTPSPGVAVQTPAPAQVPATPVAKAPPCQPDFKQLEQLPGYWRGRALAHREMALPANHRQAAQACKLRLLLRALGHSDDLVREALEDAPANSEREREHLAAATYFEGVADLVQEASWAHERAS